MKQKNVSSRIRRILTTALLLLVGGQLFAGSYTIVFRIGNNLNGSTLAHGAPKWADVVSTGAEYLTENVDQDGLLNAYQQSSAGLKLGVAPSNPSANGKITLTFSEKGKVMVSTIVVTAMSHKKDNPTTLEVNGMNHDEGTALVEEGFADYTYTLNSTSPITSLTLTSDKYCYIQSITVNYISVQVGDTGYSTLFLNSEVIIPTGVEAYYVTAMGNMAYLHKLQEVIPANTGVVIKAAQGEYPLTKSNTGAASPSDNQLVGFIQDTQITGNTELAYYALNYEVIEGSKQVGFFIPQGAETPHSTFTAKANKAYLRIETPNGGLYNVLRMRYGYETQIDGMDIERQHEIYDLLGRRVEKVKKGIYIVNGKKVVYER